MRTNVTARRRGVLAALTALTLAGTLASAGTAHAETHRLDCVVNTLAYKVRSGKLTLQVGQRLEVDLVSSGGHKLQFCAEPYGGGIDHGCTCWVNPGAHTQLVWHNGTAGAKDVQLIVGRQYPTTVHARGSFHVR
ncbi:hypothetical protein [Streptomyces sp. CB03238]|uniref:hypothetical protein n=1 Tax=Streptomyces sp. CB03238 TaxID=1907777 RepID=UPI000A102D85|nr:hypothetical protein [Streptomyces sp. CB03238]ORT56633.1 hypothetical protein BKD26_27930 [Streptomyces sp. CB03238]